MITKKYYKLIRVSYADEGYFCLTNVSNSIGNVKITVKEGDPGTSGENQPHFEYSTDGVTWNTYNVKNTVVQVDPNSNIYWRYAGSYTGLKGNGFNYGFDFDFDCYASGNFMSLFSKTDFASYTGRWDAYKCFANQTHLLKADFNMGAATTVYDSSMRRMFAGCTNLTSVPDLSGITEVQGSNYGYGGMSECFDGCSSLTTAPDLRNITSVGERGMYRMFYQCSSLTTAPDLRNITSVGEYGMFGMFYQCSSLTTAPDLSNITSVGEHGMYNMFQYCTSLSTAYAPTITWDTLKTQMWLGSVAASGTLYADASIASTIPTNSADGCPNGWTVANI